MKVAVLKETVAGEKRAAAVPATVEKMVAAGIVVRVQAGAGVSSGFSDGDYRAAGATISGDADGADVVLKVQRPADQELNAIPERAALIAYSLQSRGDASYLENLKRRRISALSLDLLNIPSAMAFQASQLYSRNVLNFLMHLYDKKAGKLSLDPADEIVKSCLIAHAGEVLQPA